MLSHYLRSQAEWRRQEKKEYPMDLRNEKSAAALESLAEFVEGPDAPSAAIDRLRPHLFDESTLGGDRAQRVVVRYGYGTAATRDHHVAMLEELGALCELDAAKAGVSLPWQYFERRPRSTQTELKEAVERYRAEGEGEGEG